MGFSPFAAEKSARPIDLNWNVAYHRIQECLGDQSPRDTPEPRKNAKEVKEETQEVDRSPNRSPSVSSSFFYFLLLKSTAAVERRQVQHSGAGEG
jgi:hypothetical protein